MNNPFYLVGKGFNFEHAEQFEDESAANAYYDAMPKGTRPSQQRFMYLVKPIKQDKL